MTEHTVADIWREIKRYVNPTDRADAAETVVAVMIDHDSDPDIMLSAFAGDADLKRALQGYLDNDRGDDDDEEYVEEDDSDSDWN